MPADAVWKKCEPFNNLSAVYVDSTNAKWCVGRDGLKVLDVAVRASIEVDMLDGDGYEWVSYERGDDIPAGAVVLNGGGGGTNEDLDDEGVCQPAVVCRVEPSTVDFDWYLHAPLGNLFTFNWYHGHNWSKIGILVGRNVLPSKYRVQGTRDW